MTMDSQTTLPAVKSEGAENWDLIQRIAKPLTLSDMVPETYQNNLPNCIIAVEMARVMGLSPMTVMQNLHIIKGRPSWSAQFIVTAINSSGRFSPIRYRDTNDGILPPIEKEETFWENKVKKTKTVQIKDVPNMSCYVEATCLTTGEILKGTVVDMRMAVLEGWYTKPGSKWQTMPAAMLRKRAASFFGRDYCPELLAGLHTRDELQDIQRTVERAEPIGHVDVTERLAESNTEEPPHTEAELVDAPYDFDPNEGVPDFNLKG